MRKIFLLTLMMFLFASLSIAQTTFSPTILQVTCPEEVQYAFGDEVLSIPVTVENLSGAFWLVINTSGKADQVDHVRNGYLGWHFVDRIDTTVYVSGRLPLEIGDNTITWDGTSNDIDPAVKLPEDTYAYYIYGYDDKTLPQLVTSYVRNATQWDVQNNFYICYDESGMALEKPVILGNHIWYLHGQPAENITNWYNTWREEHGGEEPPRYLEYGCAWKWEIGGNPDDINNLQTTWMPFYRTDFEGQPMFHAGQPIVDFDDTEYYYHVCRNNIGYENTMFRWKFVAGGDAERDEDFMGYENVMWEGYPTFKTEVPTITTLADGSSPYFYTSDLRWHIPNDQWTPFTCINIDEGAVVFDIQLDEYYLPDQENGRGEFNGTPSGIYSRELNRIQMSSWAFCLQQMVDTTVLLDDPYDEDYIVWQNQNGDYFMDKKFLPTDDYKWICSAIDSSPYTCSNFVMQTGIGNFWRTSTSDDTNQTIVTHDGTGVADIKFFGGTALRGANGAWVDSGSQYDGIYTPRINSTTDNPTTEYMHFFVSQDSDGGMIVPLEPVGVEEEAVEAYAIEQNAPNPFNPTTTIGFKLANTGNVTIDVFNVAGQKVDTIVNNLMEAGSHSVVWDASGFSAGVYFYTVKSGNFTKTMKMTLLK